MDWYQLFIFLSLENPQRKSQSVSSPNSYSHFLLREVSCEVISMCFLSLFSLAVLAGGAEWGSGARRGGVSCCRGSGSPLGKLGGCPERCWEGTGWRLADWWSCTQMWTSIQKPCPGPDPEGERFKQKHTHKKHMYVVHARGTGESFLNCYFEKTQTEQCRAPETALPRFHFLSEREKGRSRKWGLHVKTIDTRYKN